jgi:hypothetical protein
LDCEVATQDDILVWEHNLNQQEFYLKNSSPARLLETDDSFHRELFRICNKMQIHNMISSMSTHFDRVREMSLSTVKDIKIVQDHRTVLDAIKAGDKDLAKATMEKHLSRYKLDEEVIRGKYPHFLNRFILIKCSPQNNALSKWTAFFCLYDECKRREYNCILGNYLSDIYFYRCPISKLKNLLNVAPEKYSALVENYRKMIFKNPGYAPLVIGEYLYKITVWRKPCPIC